MDFKLEGPLCTEKYCWAPVVGRKEKFLHSRSSRMAKTLTLRPFLVVSALKLLSFFLCFPFVFLLRKKVRGHGSLSAQVSPVLISHLFLVFLSLILSKQMLAGKLALSGKKTRLSFTPNILTLL